MMLINSDKQKKVALTLLVGVGLSFATYSNASAVYQVHDNKVYVQVMEQVKRATEQLNKLKEQYDLQLKNIQSLKKENIDPIVKDIGGMFGAYEKLKGSMSSIITGAKDAPTTFKETFRDLTHIDFKKASYDQINGSIGTNRQVLEKTNQEIMELITKNQEALKKSNERIRKLTDLIPKTEGEKAIAELNAHIAAENVTAGNIAAEIQALATKQKTIQAQIMKLEKDGQVALQKKASTDFIEAGKQLKGE